ncbi:MAG: CsiV family protein [Pseudomonadota bacterium]
MKLITLIIFIFIALNPALARDYAVEVIIFVNQDGLRKNAEQFNPNIILPVPRKGLSFFEINEELDTDNQNQDLKYSGIASEPDPWRLLPEADYILKDQVRKLRNSSRYKILNHFAWRQPAVDKSYSQPIIIKAGFDYSGIYPERTFHQIEFSDTDPSLEDEENSGVWELEGTINVVITRYIHFYSDLVYRAERTNPYYENDSLQPEKVLVDYEVKSHRKMKSRELNYIDHPIVGILVEATPIDEDD